MKRNPGGVSARKGRKPASAYAAEEAARLNIQNKVALIERVIDIAGQSTGDADKVASFLKKAQKGQFPRSLRQFHLWVDGEALEQIIREPIPSIRTVGNGTLAAHLELRVRVERALAKLHELENNSTVMPVIDRPTKLARELKVAKGQIAGLERELISMRRSMKQAEKERDDIRTLYEALKRRFRDELERALRGQAYRGGATVTSIRGDKDD
jgi:hypothetical protein